MAAVVLHCLHIKHLMDAGLKQVVEKHHSMIAWWVEMYINTTWKRIRFNFPVDALFVFSRVQAAISASIPPLLGNIVCL